MISRGPKGDHGFPVVAGHLPFVGHYPLLNRDPWRFFRSAINAYGDFFWVDMGFGAWTLAANGEAAFNDLIMCTDAERSQRSLARENVRLLGRRVISALDGDEHRRARRPLVHALSQLEQLAPMVQDLAERSVDALLERGGGRLSEVTRVYTMSVVLGLLGIPSQLAATWQRAYGRFTLGFVPLDTEFFGSPRWLALRTKRWIDARLSEQIDRARSQPGKGLIHTLVAEQGEDGVGLSDEELLDNLRNLVTAGVHTSAQTITWMLSYLATDRLLWKRVADEVEQQGELPRSAADLAKQPLLTGLLRETMRLRPIMVGLSRIAGPGLCVGDRPMPPGVKLTVPLPALLTDPQRYRDPMRFDPDRWIGREDAPARIDTAGFGGGAHFCAGHLLTWLETNTFVSTLVRAATRRGLRLEMDRLPGTRVLGPALEARKSETDARLVALG